MALILGIETATETCSVALAQDGNILAMQENTGQNEHSSRLNLFVEEVLREAGLKLPDLDAVAVSMGPGSYTGLRIGVSAAKGWCYALDKPLIAVETLKAMALKAKTKLLEESQPLEKLLFCPMIDARRMEVYCALFDENLHESLATHAAIVDEHSFLEISKNKNLLLFGNGASKCKELFANRPEIRFLDHHTASAQEIVILANEKFKSGDFVDTAYFEPFYLKDFVAGKPHVKGLR